MRIAKLLVSGILLAGCLPIYAADYRMEYDKKIKTAQEIGALGTSPAGESINFYTGATSFSATDISVKGNGMVVSLSRSYDVELERQLATAYGSLYEPEIFLTRKRLFGDWDLSVPHVSTVMTYDGGWVIDSATPTNRCSVIGQTLPSSTAPATGAPPALGSPTMPFAPADYWSGYTLHAGGSQSMLVASLTNNERPSSGGPYHWTTNQDWWISCLSTITGGSGEGFLARGPDGSKYWFDKLSKRRVNTLSKQGEVDLDGYGTRKIHRVFRAEYLMLPSRIEDRFGNWTTFSWSSDEFAKLNSISSGQAGSTAAEKTISLTYDTTTGFVASASDGRLDPNGQLASWTYEYTGSSLSKVVLPDGSFWQYSLSDLSNAMAPVPTCEWESGSAEWVAYCYGSEVDTSAPGPSSTSSTYVIHPAGVRTDFVFANHFQHSYGGGSYPVGIRSKTLSGPGLQTATWKYAHFYEGPYSSVTRLVTDELGPDGSVRRRIFGLVPNQDEGLLLGELAGGPNAASGGGSATIAASARWGSAIPGLVSPTTGQVPTFFHEHDYRYVPENLAPYVVKVGVNPLVNYQWPNTQTYGTERRLPQASTTQYLQGTTFKSEVPVACANKHCFDAYAKPTRRVTSSAGGAGGPFSRAETYTFQTDTAKWVVGLPTSTTCTGNSDCTPDKVVSSTQYDATTLLPWKTYSFGQLAATMTYNPDGTLASATDARTNSVTLGSWTLGTPEVISFPTQTPGVTVPIQADVDAEGKIAWTKDELGSKTCYAYDVMARLKEITYPSETTANTCDTTAWQKLNRQFVRVNTAEYGISAGHWRQEVTTGNGKSTTYYDGMWRPTVVVSEDTSNTSSRSFVVQRYDVAGRLAFKSYPVGTLTSVNDPLLGVRTTYDAFGRVTRVQQDSETINASNVLNTDTAYIGGFRTQVTNPRGHVTTTGYQVFDQPSTDAPVRIDMPEGVATTIHRQPSLGKTVRVTRDGPFAGNYLGAVRRYMYDAQERLCQTIEPESGATIVAYDANGNIDWGADGQPSSIDTPAGRTEAQICADDRASVVLASRISRTYDPMNRELTRTTPGGVENVTTTYFPDGQVHTITAANPGNSPVTTTYTYNKRRLLIKEVLSINAGAAVWTFDYAYNNNGHLSSQTYPGNLVVGYAPDGLGRPTQAGTFATGVTYYPNGAMSGFTYGNGIVHTMTQNARQLPIRSLDSYVTGGVATKVLDDNYTYDQNGNVMSLSDASNAPSTSNRSWGGPATPTVYDGLDRLLKVFSANWGTTTNGYNAIYSYDPLDNLRTNQLGASVLNYTYDTSNRITQLSNGQTNWAVGSDTRGNIVSNAMRSQAYQFDLAHRMSAVTGKESYLYDGHGRRARTLNLQTGTIEYFGYGKDGRLLQDWSNRRQVRNGYIYLGNTLVGLYEVNLTNGTVTPKYQHTDALGSPVVTTKKGGLQTDPPVVVSRMSYTPYGQPTLPMDGAGYTGHFIDVGTQLTYMQQRYYDPAVGRFLSIDPVAANHESGENFGRYWYANNNPYRFVDPDGRASLCPFPENCPTPEDEEWQERAARSHHSGRVNAAIEQWKPAVEAGVEIVDEELTDPWNLLGFGLGGKAGSSLTTRAGGGHGLSAALKSIKVFFGLRVGAKFGSEAKLADHFARHGGLLGIGSAKAYENAADGFLTARLGAGTLQRTRKNGDVVRFNPTTNEFGVLSASGTIRTYYIPEPKVHGFQTNWAYFNAQ